MSSDEREILGSRAGERTRRLRTEESTTLGPNGAGSGAAHVGAGILLSRLAGLAREIITAGFLALGPAAEAFRAALRIPNLMQNLLGEGVLSASFIPIYSRLIDGDDEEEAGATAGAIAGILAAATAVLVFGGIVAAEPITILLTPGFQDDPEKMALTVDLVRLMFPGIGMLVLSAWCLAILNSHRRFFLSYVAPVIWNMAQIAVVAAVAIGGSTDQTLAEGLAWGVVAGGALQFLVQLPSVLRLVPKLKISLDDRRPQVRDALSRLGPVVFGRGVVQLSAYVDLMLASLLVTGALAANMQAQVLYLLPVSLFGMSVAAAELPELSRLGQEESETMLRRVEAALGRVAFFVVPTAVFYILIGERLVAALFEWNRFDASDTRLVWLVLAAYALGLIATTASRLLQNTLYSLDDPRTPARVALVRVLTSTAVALSLMFILDEFVLVGTSIEGETAATSSAEFLHLGGVGIALGSAAGAWCEFLLLRKAVSWRIGKIAIGGGRIPKLGALAIGAGAVGLVIALVLPDLPDVAAAIPILGIPGLIYLGVCYRLGMDVRKELGAR